MGGGAIAAATLYKAMRESEDDDDESSAERRTTRHTVDDAESKRRMLRDRAEAVILEFGLPTNADDLMAKLKYTALACSLIYNLLKEPPQQNLWVTFIEK